MKRVLLSVILMSACLLLPLRARDTVLGELVNPETLTVRGDYLYVTEGVKVWIYSHDGSRLVNSLGKAGEGPWEFRKSPAPWIPSVSVQLAADLLVVNSIGKVSYFSLKGDGIREEKVAVGGGLAPITALGKRWVRTSLTRVEGENKVFFVSNLMDEKMNKIRELGRFPHFSVAGKTNPIANARIFELLRRYSDGALFFHLDPHTGVFKVFDTDGGCKAEIRPGYHPVPITDAGRKRWEEYFLHDVRFKRIYEADRANIHYPDHLPLVRDHRPDNGLLYIVTSEKSAGGYRTLIYDYAGVFKGEILTPLADRDMLESQPFTIHKHKLYQLVEDEDGEEWVLRVTPLSPPRK